MIFCVTNVHKLLPSAHKLPPHCPVSNGNLSIIPGVLIISWCLYPSDLASYLYHCLLMTSFLFHISTVYKNPFPMKKIIFSGIMECLKQFE